MPNSEFLLTRMRLKHQGYRRNTLRGMQDQGQHVEKERLRDRDRRFGDPPNPRHRHQGQRQRGIRIRDRTNLLLMSPKSRTQKQKQTLVAGDEPAAISEDSEAVPIGRWFVKRG